MNIARLILPGLLLISVTFADTKQKSVFAYRTLSPPIIDGVVDDEVWKGSQPATDFYRFQPESGGHAPVKTELRFLYDDVALYVAAIMYDPEPMEILTQLGKRDDDNVVADWLGLWISPFNDGANELNFAVTASGIQIDRKFSPNNVDNNWNPVWTSDVSIHAQGWFLEMEIPFSQIRFPSKDIQTWGLNIARYRAREREAYTWTALDKAQDNFAQQSGLLHGIENIETPLRLSFTPYAAASIEHYPFDESGKSNFSSIYRGGMDLKYGINESFTLDMTLIPDFGQVQSDNQELNLTPFEIRYDEHRPFFTEGTQLLHKAGLFYSRRVGSRPVGFWNVYGDDVLGSGDEIISNPDETQLINATKVTGQTINGIGLGFFNAITAETHAVIRDSVGNEREYVTNPLTNYNLVIVGKNLKNGSDFSLVNTNVQRFSGDDNNYDFRDANVIGFETRLLTADSKWILEANGGYDQLIYADSVSTGYKYYLGISEGLGALQYGLGHNVESEFYNPNDMGYLRQPNEYSQHGWISLRTLDPVWKVNSANIRVSANYSSRFNPRVYSSLDFNAHYNISFKNYLSWGGGLSLRPKEGHNYDEPRIADRYFTVPTGFNFHTWLSSNYNKAFSMNGWGGASTRNRRGAQWHGGGITPRWRVNNRWLMRYEAEMHLNESDHGFADYDSEGAPIFGKRDQVTITNSFYSSYIVSRNLESDIRMRYYRSSVEYLEFFDLLEDGNLSPSSYSEDLNTVFGAFTIDAVMTWRFSPGSELNITWKNAIFTYGDNPGVSYLEDVKGLPDLDQSNSLSFKLLYYVDTWNLKHKL
ncbi:MAG: DUF5916 domain-containing protein [Candidatus Marinimicrobia bacterium]|nr:DUF5916 domain-containing protein [Candidatus Neomarinimicrobiota bacterium]